MDYTTKEQFRMITDLKEFLEENRYFDVGTYVQFVNKLGSGMLCNLRLVPDKDLEKRLSHLLAVLRYASGEFEIVENQSLVSIEGSNPLFRFDCDLILRNSVSGEFCLCDLTSSRNSEILKEKNRVLESKTLDPSLRDRKVTHKVVLFDPERFHTNFPKLCRPQAFKTPETMTLSLLETLASRSEKTNELFISNCHRVAEYAFNSILAREFKHSGYSSSKTNDDKIKYAIRAAQSNNIGDICNLIQSTTKKQYSPFIDTIKEITAQFHTVKEPFIHRIADLTNSDQTLESLLLELSEDPLAKVLFNACNLPDRISALTRDGIIMFLDKFPVSGNNRKILDSSSGFTIAAKRIRGHYFKILFSYDYMDDQLKRSIAGTHFPSQTVPSGSKSSIEECIEKIRKSEHRLNDIGQLLNRRITRDSHSTIFDKIISLANASKQDTGNLGIVASNLLSSTCFTLSRIIAGALISHQYEIVKTFSSSIKNSHKDECYYVGINGAYSSVTITKMSATQDSFDRSHYSVISKNTQSEASFEICWKKHTLHGKISRSQFRTLDTNEVAYSLRLPYYILSLLTWDIESSLKKGRLNTAELPEKITSSILHSVVNRDTFSQAAQQVRYLYTSSIGFGASAAKIADKINFVRPKFVWEYVYLIRMIKLGLSLSILRDNDQLSQITSSGELQVVFPHSSVVSPSFTHTVSSMYYCNIFNKFRSFHEVSEAFCYNELDEEFSIYEKAREEHPDSLSGFSYATMARCDNVSYLLSEDFVHNECNFVDVLLDSGVNRFQSSLAVVISASGKYIKLNDSNVAEVYRNLNRSPIEACTLRGSMEHGPSSDKNQGCRAASAMLEELMRQYEMDPGLLNNNSWLHTVFMDKIEQSGGDSSIINFVINQLADESVTYIYRIVQKDQIGNREISVLNAVFRLGALFVETISRTLSSAIRDVDLLEDSDKDYTFEVAIKSSVANAESNGKTLLADNSDQKRWGPNHMLNIFAGMFYSLLYKERGLLRLIYYVSDKVLQKRAKFPESLIRLFEKYTKSNSDHTKISKEGLNSDHGSDTLKTFFSNHASDLMSQKYDKELPYGMCQGIFHSTSSLYHAIMCKFIHDLVSVRFRGKVSIRSFCTSDDSSRIILLDKDLHRLNTLKEIHGFIIMTGCLFNIIRNDAKSSFSFHISEFNSIFFRKNIMATPSLKQRISKIDVGSGSNHVEDYLTALSASSNYFTAGGSYSGTYILTLLNIALHTEQWSRWSIITSGRYSFPVELNGFPVIEPFATCLSGAISNLYLRTSSYLSPRKYAQIFSSIITEKPEEFTLSDYYRIPKSLGDYSSDIKIFKNSGALGIHSLIRSDKKLSQFEQRHKMSLWDFPEHFLSLRHSSSDSRYFLYNIYKNGCMSLFSDSLGVNSFFKRFTDPWVSKQRACVKISKHSILVTLGLSPDIKYSYDSINKIFFDIHPEEVNSLITKIIELNPISDFTSNLIDQLEPRLKDADDILDFLNSQECSEYIEPKFTPATSRITLRGHEALDQEKYTADLLKVLAGENARLIITELYNDHRKFDTLPSSNDCPNMKLKDAILVAENSIFAFNKYIKRNTKMITSGKPENLSSLVTMILKSRFFEGIGVRLVSSLKLIGDRSHAFAYTNWYKNLNESSREYSNTVVNNSCKQLYSDVVKFGIISDAQILTQKDHFQVSDVLTEKKHVKISARSRSSLISFVKSWVGADCDFSFSYDSLQTLFQGRLINRNDFRVDDNSFTRGCVGVYFDISANNLPVVHLLHTDQVEGEVYYKHVFLVESSSSQVKFELECTELGRTKSWARELESHLNNSESRNLNTTYYVPGSNDTYLIKTITTASTYQLDVCPHTATISLISTDHYIPICHVDVKSIEDLKLGPKLNHSDIVLPVTIYSDLLDKTNDLKSAPDYIRSCLNFILYKSSLNTNLKTLNRFLVNNNFGFQFENLRQLDVFRSLLLSDNYASKTISTTKLYNYINNLFSSPQYKESYVLSLEIEDNMTLRLGDIMEDPDDRENEALGYDEDVGSVSSDGSSELIALAGGIDEIISDVDDIEFGAFDESDILDQNEQLFSAFDINVSEDSEDQLSIKSSRTGITVNPNNEVPYGILRYIQKWYNTHTIRNVQRSSRELQSVIDIPKVYLTSYRLTGFVPEDLIYRLTGSDEFELPCQLSDLVVIRSTLA